jgi:transcriptional regulator with XRE-family HTH domain
MKRPSALDRLLGRRLRRAREDAGLTQVQAAAALGVTQTLISNAERGHRMLKHLDLFQFAQLYGTTIEALAGPLNAEEQDLAARWDRMTGVERDQAVDARRREHRDEKWKRP